MSEGRLEVLENMTAWCVLLCPQKPDFCGTLHAFHGSELKGNNDILTLTCPDIIKAIHLDYLASGSGIIETNKFNGTGVSQADYQLNNKGHVMTMVRISITVLQVAYLRAVLCTGRGYFRAVLVKYPDLHGSRYLAMVHHADSSTTV
jgi:Homocysteine S-methyltransferase